MDILGHGTLLSHVHTCDAEYCYCMYLKTCYTMHQYDYFIRIYCHIDSPACMRCLSLYSRYIEHCSCYMDYSYMSIPVFSLHDYIPVTNIDILITGHVSC